MNRITLKEMSKNQISGSIGILLLMYIVIYVSVAILGLIPAVGGIIVFALSCIFDMQLNIIYLGLTHNTSPEFIRLFDIFKNQRLCGNSILLHLLISIFTFLWSLLFIVPGIIKGLSYSMAPFILAENEYYMSPSDAIKESIRITYGRKKDLFVLMLSFIPWYLLCFVTCGIALIYVEPYVQTTLANFYNEIKDSNPETIF